MRIRIALLASSLLALSATARADTDWFASLYTNEGVELRADERIFALYAVLNGLGYDEAPVLRALPVPARDLHPVRVRVRSEVKVAPGLEQKLGAYFDTHPWPAEAYGRYVLALKGPGGFERLPASPADLKGFEPLLADGYSSLNLAALFASVQADYRTALKSYHGVVDAPIGAVRKLLKLKEDEPPRVVLVVNLLDGQGTAYSALAAEELWVVVGPSKSPDLFAVAREVARARLEPLVAARSPDAATTAQVVAVLSSAFASSALALSEAELEARSKQGAASLKDWTRQVDAFGKTDKPLEAFVGEAVPGVLKELGKEPPGAAKKPAGKKK